MTPDSLGYDAELYWEPNGDVSGRSYSLEKYLTISRANFRLSALGVESTMLLTRFTVSIFSSTSLIPWDSNFEREGIWQNKIDIATGTSLTEAKLIDNGTLENNSSARPESPHIYKRKGTYYLLIAEGV